MGYTHYWNFKREPRDIIWRDFVMFCKQINVHGNTRDLIRYEHDSEEPGYFDDYIRFNGIGGDGHETFLMMPQQGFEFCKTARKPYDRIVTAILATAKYCFGDAIEVNSDGDEADWQEGIELARAATGEGHRIKFPVDKEN